MANPIVNLVLRVTDQASSVLGKITGAFAGLGSAVAAFFGARSFVQAIDSAAQFERQIARVGARTQATAQDLDALRAAAEKAGAETEFTATQAAEGLEILGAAGFSARQSIEALNPTLRLAQIEGVGLSESASLISNAISIMGLAVSDTTRIVDAFVKGSALSNTTASQLGVALSFAGGEARAAGLSLEQTVAALDALAKAGITGERAGTGLRSVLAQLADPASKAREELARLGDQSGDLANAIDTINAAGERGGDAIRAFGIEAGPSLRGLLSAGTDGLQGYLTELLKAGGASEEAANRIGNNLTGALRSLGSAWDAARRALVDPLLEPLAQQARRLADALRNAASDGAIGQLAQQIREAFDSAAQSIERFVTGFDFAEAKAKLDEFVGGAKSTFEGLNTAATATANTIRIVFNSVTAPVRALVASVTDNIGRLLGVLATVEEAVSRIGLGTLERADQLRAKAQAALETAAALMADAKQDFNDIGDAANNISDAFEKTQENAEKAAVEIQTIAGESDNYRQLRDEVLAFNAAVAEGAQSAEEVAQAAENLRLKWATQAQAGQLSFEQVAGAVSRLNVPLEQSIQKTEEWQRKQQSATEQAAAAFDRLGIEAQSDLNKLAADAVAAFERIRSSATSAPEDIRRAFLAAAQAQIDAAEFSTEAERRALAVRLELQGATLGLTEEIRQLTGANDAAAASTKKISDAQERVAAAATESENAANSATDALEGQAEAAEQSTQRTASVFTFLRNRLNEYSEKLDEVYLATLRGVNTFNGWLTNQARLVPNAIRLWEAQTDEVVRMTEVLRDEATPITNNLIQRAEALARGYGFVSEQELGPLREALEDVRRKTESANDALEQLIRRNEELALQRAGDEEALAQLELQRELNRIEEAEQAGADKRLAAEARASAEREHRAKLREIREREEAERESRQRLGREESAGDTTPRNGNRPRGGISQQQQPFIQAQQPVNNITINLGGVLDVNDKATLDKLGRKLLPVFNGINRRLQ